MSEIKISNRLLSWVLGFDCEFKGIVFNSVIIRIKNMEDLLNVPTDVIENLEIESFNHGRNINLHTFIHIAKIKCFECGYSIDSFHDSVEVVTLEGMLEKIKIHEKEPYSIVEIIDCLEWVSEKVGEKNETN